MRLLTLKTIALDAANGTVHSPDRPDFQWGNGTMVATCSTCKNIDVYNPNCTHGIYTSPNPEALDEYARYKNSIFVLGVIYGWFEPWPGPADLPNTFIFRSWGVRVVGLVNTALDGSRLSPQRWFSAVKASEIFNVQGRPWNLTQAMITESWKQNFGVNPYLPLTDDEMKQFKERLNQ